jgi:glycosyltransferase
MGKHLPEIEMGAALLRFHYHCEEIVKVSIITVCLNSAETIEDTIQSVLSQDHKDIEYIVVDGGSTDGTIEVVNNYKDKISKFTSEPDEGIYDAMNKGISACTGEVIGFLNADDFYADENVLGRVVEAIQPTDIDCCYGDLEYVANKKPRKTVRRWKSQSYEKGLFEKGWHPPHPTFFVKKHIFDKYGGFDLDYKISADYELMLRFLKKYNIESRYIPSALVKMRTGGKSNKNFWQIAKANIECYQAWKKNGLKISPFVLLRKPASKLLQCMRLEFVLVLIDVALIYVAFLLAFLVRYRLDVPELSFEPFKKSFVFLTLIYLSTLSFFGVYKSRFKSSWDLFKRVFLGLFLGTLLSIAFVYVFRIKWGAFPTSVFILSFFINLFLIFKINQRALKSKKKIKKKVVIIGESEAEDIAVKKADVVKSRIDEIERLIEHEDVDEIVICGKTQNHKDLNLLMYLVQKLKVNVIFSPSTYLAMLPDQINGNNSIYFLSTFIGKKSDVEEFFIRAFDIFGSGTVLILLSPLIGLISLLIKLTSPGPVFYKQQRAGKDAKVFTLYKLRTMTKDAEQMSGFSPATENDPRVTKVGKYLRRTRLDELPQLLNVIKGEMSLVGPRPENLYRVENHKGLQGLRLAVKPGITGLAQIRSFYDLKPKHKIKYDYLYIQQRSLLLNLYILAKTIPVVFSKKGW